MRIRHGCFCVFALYSASIFKKITFEIEHAQLVQSCHCLNIYVFDTVSCNFHQSYSYSINIFLRPFSLVASILLMFEHSTFHVKKEKERKRKKFIPFWYNLRDSTRTHTSHTHTHTRIYTERQTHRIVQL